MIMILAVADHYRVIPSVMAVPSAQCRYRKWVTKHILDMDTCSNGEVYNMIIRGGNNGGLDGIDVWVQIYMFLTWKYPTRASELL